MDKELLEYFNNDELAASVWKSKYSNEGEITPNDMHKRLAKEFYRIEKFYQEKEVFNDNLSEYGKNRVPLNEDLIFNFFKNFKYIVPQGRIMAGLGVYDSYRSLSNCLRLPPPKDDYSSIMYTDTMLISAAKRGAGYGLGISNLRPKGSKVSNAAKTSTGAASFMERFSFSTREVAQAGRRGACLLDIDIRHPDSLEFINSKKDRTKITGANISVKIWDDFMVAVKNDSDYILRWPCEYTPTGAELKELDSINYNELIKINNIFFIKIKAKDYFNQIVDNAWENAEPGLLLWDRITDYDPVSVYDQYKIDGTNACGEQPMSVYDTCRLICLNLFSFVKNPFSDRSDVDFDLLYKISYEQLRLGDDLIDLEIEYIQRIIDKIKNCDIPKEEVSIELSLWENVLKISKNGRRIGCGITGLGDMLAALGLKYDSKEALDIIEKVMKTKKAAEYDASIDLSILRGSFDGWDANLEYLNKNIDNGANSFYIFMAKEFYPQVSRMLKFGRRNSNLSTIAPVGTTSIMTGTTSGCEPLFQGFYMRRKKINPNDKESRIDFIDQNGDNWQEYPVLHPKFKEWVNIFYGESTLNSDNIKNIFEKSPWYGSTADSISWEKRVEIQSILQKYTDSAISSTLNIPENTTKDIVAKIYEYGWEMGLKGITIYRDGSRTGVLITKKDAIKPNFEQHDAPKRPKNLEGEVFHVIAEGNQWTIVVGLLDDKPYEVFGVSGKLGKHKEPGEIVKVKSKHYDLIQGDDVFENFASKMDYIESSLTRMTSAALRHGTDISYIVDTLNKNDEGITSFSKALARTLKKYIPEGKESTFKCPECGNKHVIFENGCKKCSCGWSAC